MDSTATILDQDAQNAVGGSPKKKTATRVRSKKKATKRAGAPVSLSEFKAMKEKIASLELANGIMKKNRVHTEEIPIDQADDFEAGKVYKLKGMDYHDKALFKKQCDALAFNEEVVKVEISVGEGENPDPVVPHVASNGIGAEVLMSDVKLAELGYLPRGVEFYTKRKYVEILARAKTETIRTRVTQKQFEDTVNGEKRTTAGYVQFTTIDDTDIGRAWLKNLRMQRT